MVRADHFCIFSPSRIAHRSALGTRPRSGGGVLPMSASSVPPMPKHASRSPDRRSSSNGIVQMADMRARAAQSTGGRKRKVWGSCRLSRTG